MAALLEVQGLNAWYGESHILHGVDMKVAEGETITILGRNGVGKTTTLRTIVGIVRARKGKIAFAGADMMQVPLHKTAHKGIGFVPEERGIFSTLTVHENLMLPPVVAAGGMTVDEIFELFPNLHERRNSPGTKLSGGEQQMLAMARILRTGVRMLLLDEPTEGLAPVIVQRIGEVLKTLRERGMTILLVEQNFRFASRIADRFYLMDHGQMVAEFPVGELPERMDMLHKVLGFDAMTMIFGIPLQALLGQLLIGLINGSFYALLSLGLAIIFGMLRVINFAHGALYMLGAFTAYLLLAYGGIGYWPALLLAPLIVGLLGAVVERLCLRRLYGIDPLYGLLFTFGMALTIEGTFRYLYGSSGQPYAVPAALAGGVNLGFMFLPIYRGWVVIASLVVCIGTWLLIEKTKLGAYLRAATENSVLVQVFGVNVPVLLTLTYGFGVALAAFAGVLAAPIYQVSPLMGSNMIIIVFAVVVVGGMGSIMGAIVTGYMLGVAEGLTKVFYPEASNIVIFVIMAIVLLLRPAGLFGQDA